MGEVLRLGWRGYPAAAMMLMGLMLFTRAVRHCHTAWPRPLSDVMEPLAWMRGFRLAVLGLALLGAGAAWLWQIPWLLAVALVVVIEETVETSIAIGALGRQESPDINPRKEANS